MPNRKAVLLTRSLLLFLSVLISKTAYDYFQIKGSKDLAHVSSANTISAKDFGPLSIFFDPFVFKQGGIGIAALAPFAATGESF